MELGLRSCPSIMLEIAGAISATGRASSAGKIGVEREERGDVMADNAEARGGRFLTGVGEITLVPPEASCVECLGCVA